MDDCREIENLIYTFAESFDLGDFEGMARLFNNGEINYMSGLWCLRGYHEILEAVRAAVIIYDDTGTPCTRHIMTNVIIEIDKSNHRATSRSYFTLKQERPGFPMQEIVSGRYIDAYLFDGKQWEFSERSILTDFYGDLSRHITVDYQSGNVIDINILRH